MSQLMMIGMTDRGRVRMENEDAIGTHPEAGLAVLADGMGGHQAGEVASRIAVDVISRHLCDKYAPDRDEPLEQRIAEAVRRANKAIHDAAQTRADYAGMGSTVVVTLFRNGTLVVGHVGDSRLYRLRGGKLEQVTLDHSVVQELVTRGLYTMEEARKAVGKNLVTRALGVDADVSVDVASLPVEHGDRYLLCSDGLNDVVEDMDIEGVMMRAGGNLYSAAIRLVQLANERGGPDNVSVILVGRDGEVAAPGEQDAADDADEFEVGRDDEFVADDK